MPNHEHQEHHEHSEHEAKARSGNSQALLPIAVLAAGIIIAAAVIFGPRLTGNQTNNGGTQNQGQTQQGQVQQVNIKNVKTTGEPFIGSPNAPVTIAEWSDWQCPFCDQFEEQTLPAIIRDYVNTGKVKIVFKDLQFLGSDSQTAGVMGRAIWSIDPQSYFKWRTYVYGHQGQENSGWATEEKLLGMAGAVGINTAQLSSAIAKNQSAYQAEIDADKQEGSSMGIVSTPSFVIGTQLIVGAQPASVFTQAINSQLQNAGK